MSTRNEAISAPTTPSSVSDGWWSKQRRFERLAIGAGLVVAAFLAAGAVNTVMKDDPAPFVPRAAQPAPAARPEAAKPASTPPPCADVAPNATGRVTCRATSATLQITYGNVPLLLEGLQARLINASMAGGAFDVRLRVRNTTSRPQVFNVEGRQVYASIGPRRVFADGRVPLQPGEAKFAELRFVVPPTRAREAQLAVLPFGKKLGPKPQDMGVIKVGLR